MKLHVVGLPHTSVNKDFGTCAYTQKLYKFMQMFPDALLYANEGSEGEYISIYSHDDLDRHFGKLDWYQKGEIYKVDYNPALPHWKEFNRKVIMAMRDRIGPQDLILIIAGWSQKEIADAFPNNTTTEFGIGYEGVFSKYRVFESYAWMHFIYGKTNQNDGSFFDAVIPNYFEVSDFPYAEKKEDYLLFMSRPIERKGIQIAKEIAEKTGKRLVVAGNEKVDGVEWVGYADAKKRGELMSKAAAVLMPTIYIEPFGGVAVEAQLCGTPVIASDWGAFPETVIHGVTGYRCRTLEQYIWAVKNAEKLNAVTIRKTAIAKYSMERVRGMYQEYFAMLQTLWGKGWYEEKPERYNLDWLIPLPH